MSWVPPFFTCGECGGEVGRWPLLNLLKQPILDWRHRTAPEGFGEHRAVLGTPAHKPVITGTPAEPESDDDDTPLPDPVPPPETPARPALAGDLPKSAASIDRLAESHGWTVEAWYMRGTRMDARWRAGRVRSSVVLRLHRDSHRLVAVWSTKPWQGVPFAVEYEDWAFDEAWSITHHLTSINSPELRELIKFPRMKCEDCGKPPALHPLTDGRLVCFTIPTPQSEEDPL